MMRVQAFRRDERAYSFRTEMLCPEEEKRKAADMSVVLLWRVVDQISQFTSQVVLGIRMSSKVLIHRTLLYHRGLRRWEQ